MTVHLQRRFGRGTITGFLGHLLRRREVRTAPKEPQERNRFFAVCVGMLSLEESIGVASTLTPPSPPGEGEGARPTASSVIELFAASEHATSAAKRSIQLGRCFALPLLGGEGWGEGEPHSLPPKTAENLETCHMYLRSNHFQFIDDLRKVASRLKIASSKRSSLEDHLPETPLIDQCSKDGRQTLFRPIMVPVLLAGDFLERSSSQTCSSKRSVGDVRATKGL